MTDCLGSRRWLCMYIYVWVDVQAHGVSTRYEQRGTLVIMTLRCCTVRYDMASAEYLPGYTI